MTWKKKEKKSKPPLWIIKQQGVREGKDKCKWKEKKFSRDWLKRATAFRKGLKRVEEGQLGVKAGGGSFIRKGREVKGGKKMRAPEDRDK